MKPTVFVNRVNGEQFVCDDTRAIETIDGVEYLLVRRPNQPRTFKMRRDALARAPKQPKLPDR